MAEKRNQKDSSANSANSTIKDFVLVQAESQAQVAQARELFLEYAQSLGFSLCFQNFEKEVAELPGDYCPPEGRLLLAEFAGDLAGCVALHKLHVDAGVPSVPDRICEMKRLYLRPKFRGKGLGRILADAVIAEARQIGYDRMRLDTVEPFMKDAVGLYRKLGFREIEPYRLNPQPGTLYMELAFCEERNS
jgi:putative acetyltransferase